LENVTELLNSVEIFVQNNSENSNLENYLEEVTLLTDIDRWDPDKPSVTLMTLHSAKGLEFPIVVVSGVEDGLIPLSKNYDDPEDLEEERRLFYVGMTRAKRRLYLLHSQTRHRFGRGDFGGSFLSMPSRFLKEIPENLLEIHSSVKPGLYEPKRLHKAEKYRKRLTEPFLEKLPDEDSEYKIGQYVKHDVFGRGQILGVDFSNLGTKLTIQFENKTIKKLIAEYANLLVNESLE
jgi:DNA helicase-2/ATP-dependent DNA helicase PcrA